MSVFFHKNLEKSVEKCKNREKTFNMKDEVYEMDNQTYFRGSIVGGYKKDDVHKCIQEIKEAAAQELGEKDSELTELTEKYNELNEKYEALVVEAEGLKKELGDSNERKEQILRYETETRIKVQAMLDESKKTADKYITDARYEAQKFIGDAEYRASSAAREYQVKMEMASKQYVDMCDGYKVQAYSDAVKIMELQKQLESVLKQVNQTNSNLRQQVNSLLKGTGKDVNVESLLKTSMAKPSVPVRPSVSIPTPVEEPTPAPIVGAQSLSGPLPGTQPLAPPM